MNSHVVSPLCGTVEVSEPTGGQVISIIQQDETKTHIRGSSVLLFGRLLALAINTTVQVLIVRYLSKSDYGAFAYALAVVSLGTSVALLGLDKAITVFVPIYHERGDYRKLFGTLIMAVGTILSIGVTPVVVVFVLHGLLAQSLGLDTETITLVLILIILVPVQALDSLLIGMFAIFTKPRAIFFRRNLLGPVLQLCIVLLLIVSHSDVRFLAIGYLGAGVLGVVICVRMMLNTLRGQGLHRHFSFWNIEMPARPVFGFTLPLLASDLVFLLRSSLAVVLLEHLRGATDVAAFRAVFPIAAFNLMVFQSFKYLFTPAAARMFARGDQEKINHLYWQSAAWIAIISFPIFAVSFSLARPLVILLYGVRYEDSAAILALLALGHYVNAAFGFNGLTLRVFGKVRYIVCVDLIMAATSICISLPLIYWYGAMGAAISTCGVLILQNVLYQAGLRSGTRINAFERRYLRTYLTIAMGAFGLLLLQTIVSNIYVNFALAGLMSLLVFRISSSSLDINQTFPELLRFPFARRLLFQTQE